MSAQRENVDDCLLDSLTQLNLRNKNLVVLAICLLKKTCELFSGVFIQACTYEFVMSLYNMQESWITKKIIFLSQLLLLHHFYQNFVI